MPLQRIAAIDEVLSVSAGLEREEDRVLALTELYLDLPIGRERLRAMDPFAEDYRQQLVEWLGDITGRSGYDPDRDEASAFLTEPVSDGETTTVVPNIYTLQSSDHLGEMMEAFGVVLRALDARGGQSVLEYGPGDGQICLALARMGCRVTAVDIEPRYLRRIKSQAESLGVTVHTLKGIFGDGEPGVRYDRILFFEAFHHALMHQDVLHTLHERLAPGGFVLFAAEPILAPDSYYRPTLPYPWGPRLDGLSLRAMRQYGWCELGFTREYFVEAAMRAGFTVEYRHHPGRAAGYIARPVTGVVDVGGPMILEASGFADCWHSGEGAHRFARDSNAAIPLDGRGLFSTARIELRQMLPIVAPLKLTFGAWSATVKLAPGESVVFDVPLQGNQGCLHIAGPTARPCDLSASSTDDRTLGVALTHLQYR